MSPNLICAFTLFPIADASYVSLNPNPNPNPSRLKTTPINTNFEQDPKKIEREPNFFSQIRPVGASMHPIELP